jgi:hypothetical protein
MKTLISTLACLLAATAVASDQPAKADAAKATGVHRYVVERTFPSGALDGVDAAAKAKVNSNNATLGVRWLQSYVSADKTKTYCIYEGPSEEAIRKAAALNGHPVDSVMEVPSTILPK